jgi:hypothetical protein
MKLVFALFLNSIFSVHVTVNSFKLDIVFDAYTLTL